jgi:hypothetical protein
MVNTYVVEGGLGKVAAFTAVVDALAKRDGEPIQVYTPYYECFSNNPNVKLVLDQGSIPITDPRIQASERIYYFEPYKSTFTKGKQHIIESFCELTGVKYSSNMLPKIFSQHRQQEAKTVLQEAGITGKYALVQFTGGQTPIGFDGNRQYQSIDANRNYPFYLAQEVVHRLNKAYPDLTVINFSLPNEPNYEGAVRINAHSIAWHEILKGADGFISIDSCLNHFSPSAGKAGVVLWSNTRWNQFGYVQNINMNFHMSGKWEEQKFNPQDPRNIMVDPSKVVEAYGRIKR